MFTEEEISEIGRILDDKGVAHSDIDAYFEHHGVRGMHWGIRRDNLAGVPNKTNRAAKSDANEFARAKMFFGQGAGTRRKLIKNTVDAKSARDPAYKKAFDHHLANQDLSVHASKAVSERHRKDAVASTKKTTRGVKNFLTNNGAPISVAALVIGTAATNPQVRAFTAKHAKTGFNQAKHFVNGIKIARTLSKSV